MKSKKVNLAGLFLLVVSVLSAQETKQVFELAGQEVELSGSFGKFMTDVKTERLADGLEIATITLTHGEGATPPEFSLKWHTPSSNVAGYWSSGSFLNKTINPDWGPSKVKSMLAREAPVIALFGNDDVNRQTFAVSEALSTVITSTSVKEEDGMIYNQVKFFTERHKEVTTYEVQFRLDTRSILFSKALSEVASWWASFDLYKPAHVPEAAKLPVYSTWYSYHQNVTAEAIIEECKLAKAIGYESVIVDDGWQTLDSSRGYAYTGDWEPERIPNMKEFVKAVHDLDMKFILWYAVPFVGEKSKAYEKMKGKFLGYWEGQGTYVVDPRYPEVREFIIDTYKKAVKEWDLDGFKLDFIGRFRAGEDTKLVAEDGRDYASVNEATDRLMTDLMKSLRALKPDIMIEFRQPYTGPMMRKYGNMFRATDCPNVPMLNRIETTDLRFLSGNTAVHADMFMWHYEEPVEVASLQVLNAIFSVPQVSVRLADIPADHFDMIKFYNKYWVENRSVLLDGEFEASYPQANYPKISARNSEKQITAVYTTSTFSINNNTPKKLDVINAKMSKEIILVSKEDLGNYNYEIKNCMGKTEASGKIELKTGANLFEVPASGLISLEKTN